MSNKRTSDRDLLREVLGRTEGCPPTEKLELALVEGAPELPSEVAQHLKTCGYCQTELHLLRDFKEGGTAGDSADVDKVAELLRGRSKEILHTRRAAEPQESWWSRAFRIPWLAPATLGMATVLVVVAVVLQYRQTVNRPGLNGSFQTGTEVLRTSSFAILKPTGDLLERPVEVRWELVQGAARYEVRFLEVDRAEVWKAATTEDHIEIPRRIQDRIVPAKTLFCEVVALDSSGRKTGDTGLIRFRLLHGGAQ